MRADESVTHTEAITSSYCQVNLGSDYSIGDIVIYNRTDDCCMERLSDFTILVIDEDRNYNLAERITSTQDP